MGVLRLVGAPGWAPGWRMLVEPSVSMRQRGGGRLCGRGLGGHGRICPPSLLGAFAHLSPQPTSYSMCTGKSCALSVCVVPGVPDVPRCSSYQSCKSPSRSLPPLQLMGKQQCGMLGSPQGHTGGSGSGETTRAPGQGPCPREACRPLGTGEAAPAVISQDSWRVRRVHPSTSPHRGAEAL